MLELLMSLLILWLGWKVLKLSFRITWGTTKVIASILLALALPALLLCLVFAGGLLLLLPLALVGGAFWLLAKCV